MTTCARCGHASDSPPDAACPACGHRATAAAWPQATPAPAPAPWPQAQAFRPEMPGASTVLVVSILVATSCCMPAGVVGVLWTEKAKKLYAAGQDAEADSTLSTAKLISYGGAGVGFVLGIIIVILQVAVEFIK